jgi:hypothetical protein
VKKNKYVLVASTYIGFRPKSVSIADFSDFVERDIRDRYSCYLISKEARDSNESVHVCLYIARDPSAESRLEHP